MVETAKLSLSFESDNIEDIISSLDEVRDKLSETSLTFGMPAKVKGTWELTTSKRCEHCWGAGEVSADDVCRETGRLEQGVVIKECVCQKK